MPIFLRFRLFLSFGVLALLPVTTACMDLVGAVHGGDAKFIEKEEKRFSVDPRPDVTLSTFDGSIEVRPWNRPEVLVVIEKRATDKEAAASIQVRSEQDGNRVRVEVTAPRMDHVFGFHFSRSARLIVSLPAESNLDARSGDGSIDVERISGGVALRSGDGSIRGRELAGDVRAHTGDGPIKLEAVDGSLDVDTGDGSIAVNGRFTTLRARTGDGSVTVHADPGSSPGDDWSITTGDGSVIVEIPDGFSAELDASTGDGGVRMDNVALTNGTGEIRKNSVRGRLGSGGRAVRVRTGDGHITLRRF